MIHRPRTALARRLLAAGVTVFLLAVAAVAGVYLWPLDDDVLHPAAQPMSFATATARIATQARAEKSDPRIRPECRSVARVHPQRSAKAVLLLHGYLGCPDRLAELAALYYEAGYNVYAPLAPRHGRTDPEEHRSLTARELTAYAGSAMDVTAALGAEAGVVGTSAGAVLATWLTVTRPAQVQRLLVIAPFYRPGPGQVPPVAVRPMTVLYGNGVLPDRTHRAGYSYAVLAQFLRLASLVDTGTELPGLKSVAVVTSPGDTFIDRGRAVQLPAGLARTNRVPAQWYELPGRLGIGHEAVDPARLGPEKDLLYARYLILYEGR